MSIDSKVKKYEIYLYDFGNNNGSIQGGCRPVLVIQNNTLNRNSTTTIIAPFTSVIKKRYLSSHVIVGKKFGLRRNSMVLLEQIRTVNQYDLHKYIGIVDDEIARKDILIACEKTLCCNSGLS